jgi:hypothetical protein
MYALVDCNNFHASCERVFNPAIRTRPVVVLSNNDGYIIARGRDSRDSRHPLFDAIQDTHCLRSERPPIDRDGVERRVSGVSRF